MVDRRIGYAKDKVELIKRLVASEDNTGAFETIADALAFAAALGLRRKRKSPVVNPVAESIRQEIFDRRNYDTMMNLIVLHDEKRAAALADSDEAILARATAFEEYANGGLEILSEELKGALDVQATTILLISAEREGDRVGATGFDLAQLVD